MSAILSLLHPMERRPSHQDKRVKKPFFKRFGTYLHLFIVIGIAAPAMVYMQVMNNLGWRLPFVGANGTLSYTASSSDAITLYASPTTQSYFSGIGGNYDLLLNPWRDYFSNRQSKFKELNDLSQIKELNGGVLVLPSAVALSTEERAEIQSFRNRGGAVLMTWASGTRNATGTWEGWQFLQSMGAKVHGEIAAESQANHLIVEGESPVSNTMSAGQRIFLSPTAEPLLRLQGDHGAGRFTNWARVTDDARRGENAVVFQEDRPEWGRTLVFGFAESTWANHPLDVYPLFDDAIQWLQHEPKAIRAAWPSGKSAAQVIEMDTEDKFNNALNFASMMQAVDYPVSFYVLTSAAKLLPDTLTQLNQAGDIGFHGDIHIGFKDQAESQQLQRLQTMRQELSTVLPDLSQVTGFRAPTESYDATTEKLLFGMGIRHHVADPNRSQAQLPLFAKVQGSTPDNDLIVLPRTQRDDINVYDEKLSVEQVTQALIDDSDLVLANAGLGVLSIHSQNFDTASVMYKALPGYLVNLKQKRNTLWLASTTEVAQWWRDRERFLVRSAYSGKRLTLDVTVIGKTPVNGGTVIVMLPQRDVLPKIQGTKINAIQPKLMRLDSFRVALVFADLAPGNYSYQVTFSQ